MLVSMGSLVLEAEASVVEETSAISGIFSEISLVIFLVAVAAVVVDVEDVDSQEMIYKWASK